MVTLRDVAAKANVSVMTVSRVINGKPVTPRMHERVQAAVEELGYIPNALARGLVYQQSRLLGLVIPDITNPFFTTVARALLDEASRQDYRVAIFNSDGLIERERQAVTALVSQRAAGIILVPANDTSKTTVTLIQQHKIPVVLLARKVPHTQTDFVGGDNFRAAYLLIRHLVELGHTDIALQSGPLEVSTARERLQGYRAALADYGIPYNPEYILPGDFSYQSGMSVAETIARILPITAAVAANNLAAAGMMVFFRSLGWDIPTNLSLVCFDDIELAADIYPFLTVVAQPARQLGTAAAHLLLRRISDSTADPPTTQCFDAEVTLRKSTLARIHTVRLQPETGARARTPRSGEIAAGFFEQESPGDHDQDVPNLDFDQ